MKDSVKQTCGDLAAHFFPAKRNSIANGESIPRGTLEKLISQSLIRKAAQSGDHETLRRQLSQYWKGDEGDSFYESFADRFENSFLGAHYAVVDALQEVLSEGEGEFSQLCEIGCGDGRVLNHLAENLTGIDRFVGLDINEKIIRKNREIYESDNMQFEWGDAVEWIEANTSAGTVVMSYGGVMEYFLQSELEQMFSMLREKSPVAVALVEPLYDGYDPEKETASRSSGMEHSFSHNHRHLLEMAGFEIRFQSEPEMEFRWMMIVATA